jgi:hypothetical protein
VAHSSDRPQPHGSSVSTRGACRVFHTLYRNGIIEAPSTNAPMLDTTFSVVKPSLVW